MTAHTLLRLMACVAALPVVLADAVPAQERLPWERSDSYGAGGGSRPEDAYRPGGNRPAPYDAPRSGDVYAAQPQADSTNQGYSDSYRGRAYGEPYSAPRGHYGEPYERNYGGPPPDHGPPPRVVGERYYSQNEILAAGHGFFGSVSKGLASVVEYAFQRAGRPNGYVLGEDAGGAFIAGLRYGEGALYTKDAGVHKVFWQGPSLGYDVGAEGSKTMVLVYNLRDPSDIYHRFGGVEGSAYFVGGVSIQFQKHGDVVLAPIRSGIGLRLGANVGYLKYTRSPTWNPF